MKEREVKNVPMKKVVLVCGLLIGASQVYDHERTQTNDINQLRNTIHALQTELDIEKVRSCGNENVLRDMNGFDSISLKACGEEGKKWQDNQKDLFPQDKELKQ